MTEPAIRVIDVTKIFPTPFRRRRVVALQDLNLEIAPGEIYGLLGPNGSGKSTTLKIILGLIGRRAGACAFLVAITPRSRCIAISDFCRRMPTSINFLPGPKPCDFTPSLVDCPGGKLNHALLNCWQRLDLRWPLTRALGPPQREGSSVSGWRRR